MKAFHNTLFAAFLAVIIMFPCAAGTASAQPDAGTLLQQERQTVPSLPERLPAEEEEASVAKPPPGEGAKVLVKGFRFTGRYEQLVTEGELQELTGEHVGTEMTFVELQYLADKITRYLRDRRGFLLARAYLPQQDVTEGIIEIAIIAGHIDGRARIDLEEPFRVKQSVLQGIADRALPEDSPARMDRIERALLLMNDLPGIEARASLSPGETPRSTRLVIEAAEGPLFQGVLTADNYGDRFTGAARASGQVSAYNVTGLADQFSLSYTAAERMRQWKTACTMPLGSAGLMGTVSYTGLSYELGKELKNLQAEGRAHTIDADLSYPLLRSRRASVWAGLGMEYLMLRDEVASVKTGERDISLGRFSLAGNFYDRLGGGGLSSALFIVTGGNVDLSGLIANKAADDAGPRTHGDFIRASYSLARLQKITARAAVFGSLRGQFADGNLDSSQKFILGGPSGIRAYPVGEAAADEGHAFTVETRYDLPFAPAWAMTQVIAFYDGGWVKLHKKPWAGAITNAAAMNDYYLSGAGIGLNIAKAGLYSLRASYAHAIGPNDGMSVTGKNADNTSDDGRFWLQLLIWL